MQFDPLNDAFTTIYNAESAGKYEVTVSPASKLLGSMLSICLLYTSDAADD